MKSSILAGVAALASVATAVPVVAKRANMDATILQFALTLEHLENVFYKQALTKFSESAFTAAGYSAQYYNNVRYISADEQSHVELLTAGLQAAGAKPVAACKYKFPFTDVKSFITLSSVLEGVGTSAYLGAAPSVVSKDYLTIAGSILVTEAIHTSLQRFTIGEIAPANPYGTPLGANEVYTLAAAFIESCPKSNTPLPFKAFPTLTSAATGAVAAGQSVSFTSSCSTPKGAYLTFINGLDTISEPATISGDTYTAPVPAGLGGQTYVLLTNANTTKIEDSQVIAGPAIIEVTPAAPAIDFNEH